MDTRSLRERIREELPDYPPIPLPAEARTPGELMEALYAHFSYTVTTLRAELATRLDLPESDRAQALLRLVEMEELLPSLQRRDPEWMSEQWRQAIILCVTVAELATWMNDMRSLQCFTTLATDGGQLPALAEALTENKLHGWKDWRDSEEPVAWVKKRTRQVRRQDHQNGGTIRSRDALYRTPQAQRELPAESTSGSQAEPQTDREAVSVQVAVGALDKIAVTPNAVLYSRRYPPEAIGKLREAATQDPELCPYINLLQQGLDRRTAWQTLGWDRQKGERVDRRYRRLRAQLRAKYGTWEPRREPMAGVSDASRYVSLEPLYEGQQGPRVAEWVHRTPQDVENE